MNDKDFRLSVEREIIRIQEVARDMCLDPLRVAYLLLDKETREVDPIPFVTERACRQMITVK